jgi:hypothetical protein
VPDQPIADFANRLRACLDADDADAALISLSGEPDALTQLPRFPRTKWYEEDTPHAIVARAGAARFLAALRVGEQVL